MHMNTKKKRGLLYAIHRREIFVAGLLRGYSWIPLPPLTVEPGYQSAASLTIVIAQEYNAMPGR